MSDETAGKGLQAQLTQRARAALTALAALSRPVRILLAATLITAIVLAVWLGQRATAVAYAPLYAQLPAEDASAVAAKLKELKVPFRVVDGGRVEVPEERVPELRLEMAGAGLPRGGAMGFEMFDKSRLGATEFEQKVLYKRALEGELVRTITSLAAVESARVHLVMPERSVFATRREPGSASVVVKVHPGYELSASEVASLVHLVASAVPGLDAAKVAIANTEGKLLRKPHGDSDDPAGGGSDDEDDDAEVKAMETTLERRARTILERVVGPGHADVQVTVDMDFARVERQVETFEPTTKALRSEELTIEKTATTDGEVAGVPGAESNLPGEDGEGPSLESAPGVVRHQHTRNYEVSRVTEKRLSRAGRIERLHVAVLLDGVAGADGAAVPREPEEIEQLTALVRAAVGASDARDDSVTVESMPFALPAPPEDVAPAPAPSSPLDVLPAPLRRVAPFAAAGLVAVMALVVYLVVRKRRQRAKSAELALAAKATDVEVLGAAPLLDPREEALRIAAEDPATAALILREWLGAAAPVDAQRAA